MRQSSKMTRIRKGDVFNDPNTGELLRANGFPQSVGAGKVQIPVIVDGADRASRRKFDADLRVRIA